MNGALPGWGLPSGLPFWLALLLAAAGSGLVGLLVERLAFAPLRRRSAEPLLALITSLGAGVVLVNLLQILMGAEGYAFPQSADALAGLPDALVIAGARIRTIQLLLLLVSAAAVLALTLWLERSRGGQALRAVAEDATTAQLLGINSEAMVRLAFFLSGALAGLGGGLIGVSVSLPGPYFGIGYGLKGLAVLVLGGLGSVPGAIAGGLLMGLAEALVPSAASGWRDALAFAILFAVLLLRPSGLLGRRTVDKV
jgi:branched-chain amino acid transport system permease protein